MDNPNEMAERVALAVKPLIEEVFCYGLDGADALAIARAAIVAMHEPTEAMLEAADVLHASRSPVRPEDVWRAMHGAILKD